MGCPGAQVAANQIRPHLPSRRWKCAPLVTGEEAQLTLLRGTLGRTGASVKLGTAPEEFRLTFYPETTAMEGTASRRW